MQSLPALANIFLRTFGLRARLIVIAAASLCWLLLLSVTCHAVFYGLNYADWLALAAAVGLALWGGARLALLSAWLTGLDVAPYPDVFGRGFELLKLALAAIFIAYCMCAFLVPGPPVFRVALGAVLALVPAAAEILLPTRQRAHPVVYHLLIIAAATPIALLAARLSQGGA